MVRVDVPLSGGPLDGREIDVEVDDDGYPPAWVDETDLWFAYGSELIDADLDGRYALEPVAAHGSLNGEPFKFGAQRLLLVTEKVESS